MDPLEEVQAKAHGRVATRVEVNQCVGSSWPSWLGRAARNWHHHAIEQVSRRLRGGRRDDSARTRRKILISTQVAAAQSAQLRSEREAEEAELEEAVARREREALQRVEAAKAALVENSLVLAESRADDDFSAASSPQLLMPAAEPLDEAIARARSAVEELRD